MLLKRVSSGFPDHLRGHLTALEEAGIKTTEHLIFTSRALIDDLITSIPAHDVDQLIELGIRLTSGASADGSKVWEEEKSKASAWQGLGVPGLTNLVEEWDGEGIVQVCGPRRVGKSLLALHSALRVLVADRNAQCHWLDTDGSFSPERAKLILETWGVTDPKEVLSKMIVTPCFRLDPDLYQALDNIRESLEGHNEHRQDGENKARIRVVVIGQLTLLFKDHLVSSNTSGHAAMLTVMEDIAELTYTHGLTTIITNGHASSVPTNPLSRFSATAIKPALGTAFTYCSDITLLLQETGKLFGMVDEGERERVRSAPGLRAVVEVIQSRVSPSGRWAVFETDGTRLFDVVPPPQEDEKTIRQSAGLQVGEARPKIGSLAQTLAP